MTHLGREKIMSRLPQVRTLAMEFLGLDIIDEPAPIQPTAHKATRFSVDEPCQILAQITRTSLVRH